MAPAGCDELADEAGKWLGEDHGLAAEVQSYLVVAGPDVV